MSYYTLSTTTGNAKLAAYLSGGAALQIAQMVLGDGNGSAVTPTGNETALVHQVYAKALDSLTVDASNPTWLVATMTIPAASGGWTIREVGLKDAAGDLVAIGNFPDTYKPLPSSGASGELTIKVIWQVSNASAVSLVIDPTVALASKSYVLDEIANKGLKYARLAATSNLTLSGIQTIDGKAGAAGDVVLVTAQTAASTNGLYVMASGAWSRATDADASADLPPGCLVSVSEGDVNGGSLWRLTTPAPITLGTTSLTFSAIVDAGRHVIWRFASKSENYLVRSGDTGTMFYNDYDVTYTLPAASTVPAGATYGFSCNTGHKATINASTGDTIIFDYGNDATSLSLDIFKSQIQIASDGANWIVLSANQSVMERHLAGMVQFFARSSAPVGWLKANGAAISRTAYARLFAVIGITFGAGDGVTTFNVPDIRAEYLRAWDDGRGVDAGRGLGTWQMGTLLPVDYVEDGNMAGPLIGSLASVGMDITSGQEAGKKINQIGGASLATLTASGGSAGMSRPRNIALLACIKY